MMKMENSVNLMRLVQTFLVLFLSLDLEFNGAWSSDEVERHLEMGKKFLQEGNLADALQHYNMAVEGDPFNYLTYFKRAAVFLALGQSRRALPDLDKVLELKPDFHNARLERASTNLKLGKLRDATADYQYLVSSTNPATEEAQLQLQRIQEAEVFLEEADIFLEKGELGEAVVRLQRCIELSPWDIKLREKRAQCHESLGQYQSAISDIKMLTKLIPDNTEGYYRASQLYYALGEEEDSLKEIRECLKLDPDNKKCFPFYKKVKKLSKQLSNAKSAMDEERYSDAIEKLKLALQSEGEIPAFVKRIKAQLCRGYSKMAEYEEGMKACDDALSIDENNLDVLCDKAELYIANEEYEEAVKVFQKANGIDGQYQRVKDGLHRAQNLLKQSQKRDYYKILGVKRSATTKDINKAYRQLAKEYHPDKYEGEENKKKAEKRFYDIAAAKEVLTNKEMREKFDNGEDPLDPEQQHQGHGGFPHGFNPFGGGGFTFKFHFG